MFSNKLRLRLTINRQFHVATKRSGTKQIQSGAKPVTPAGRVPRISRLLALAHHCLRLVQSGAIINQSELAHFGQISTTRMTQIMWLDNFAPDIQEEILFLPRTPHPYLASLPRMYPGLHHTYQKFSLLVLIQFVLKVVIHLARSVQREKLRGSLGDVGRRPKIQNLFIGRA